MRSRRARAAYFIIPGKNECQRKVGRDKAGALAPLALDAFGLGAGGTAISELASPVSTPSTSCADGQREAASPLASCTRSIAACAWVPSSNRTLANNTRTFMAMVSVHWVGKPHAGQMMTTATGSLIVAYFSPSWASPWLGCRNRCSPLPSSTLLLQFVQSRR